MNTLFFPLHEQKQLNHSNYLMYIPPRTLSASIYLTLRAGFVPTTSIGKRRQARTNWMGKSGGKFSTRAGESWGGGRRFCFCKLPLFVPNASEREETGGETAGRDSYFAASALNRRRPLSPFSSARHKAGVSAATRISRIKNEFLGNTPPSCTRARASYSRDYFS